MLNGIIQYGLVLLIVALWGVTTFWAFSSVRKILRVRNLDSAVTLRLVWKALTKNPFSALVAQVRERIELVVSLEPREGITLRPQGGEVISGEYLQDRRQYLLSVSNPSRETLSSIELLLQFPYPVETYEVSLQKSTTGVSFAPTTMISMMPIGGGSAQVFRRPLYADYQLQISQLGPEGRLELFVLLNSWRDSRGRVIPPGEGGRYFIPKTGPQITYIYGPYSYSAAGETIRQEYYAPLLLDAGKTVSLGPPANHPDHLTIRRGFQ